MSTVKYNKKSYEQELVNDVLDDAVKDVAKWPEWMRRPEIRMSVPKTPSELKGKSYHSAVVDEITVYEKVVNTMRPLVIYHSKCRDGFCAAWVCNLALKANWTMYKLPREDRDPEFYEGVFGQPPPDVKGRDVVLVDFSYPRDQMFTLAKDAKSLLVLDHHKTAQETLQLWVAPQNTTVIFDMNKSGAGLAWDYYFPKAERPFLVNYVEDRDLWNWKLPHSRELNAYISILPFVFEAWTAAHIGGMIPEGITESIKMGRAALAKTAQYVAEVKKNAYLTVFEGHTVPIVNAPQVDISELVHSLCEDGGYHPFAMGFGQRSDGMFAYSLRSIGDFDVSELAKRYGGGGHKNSAGFTSHGLVHNWTSRLVYDQLLERLASK